MDDRTHSPGQQLSHTLPWSAVRLWRKVLCGEIVNAAVRSSRVSTPSSGTFMISIPLFGVRINAVSPYLGVPVSSPSDMQLAAFFIDPLRAKCGQ